MSAPPERGAANDAVTALLAKALGVPRPRVTLAAGLGGREKIVHIDGMAPGDVEARLVAGLKGGAA